MKKFKLISCLLALCIFMSSIGFTSFAAEEAANDEADISTDERYELVYDLGVMRGYNHPLTRAEFCEAVEQIITYNMSVSFDTDKRVYPFSDVTEDTAGFEAIKALTYMGILRGSDDGFFHPDEPIKFMDAIVIAIRALDLEAMVENNNYMYVAQERELLENMIPNAEGTLDEANAVKLLYNMLMSEVFVDDGKFYYNTKDYFYQKLGLKWSKGQVTDDGLIALDGESRVKNGQIIVDGVIYYNKTNVKDLLGKNVFFYYLTNQNDEHEIVSLICRDGGSVTIDAEYVIKYSNYTYTISSDAKVGKRFTLPKDFTLIYNGRPVKFDANLTQAKFNELMNPDTGSVTLYEDKNGDYSLVRVMSYVNMVVGNTSFIDGYFIYDKYPVAGITRGLAVTDDDAEFMVKNLNGNILDKSMIKNNDTISYAASYDNMYYEIIVSNTLRDDIVTGYSDDMVIVGEEEYSFAKEYEDAIKNQKYLKPSLGNAAKVYLNYRNKVVYIDAISTNGVLAMIGNYDYKDSFQGELQMSVYTEQGNYMIIDVSKNLIINGKRCKNTSDVKYALDIENVKFDHGALNYTIARINYIEKDGKYVLRSIDTPYYLTNTAVNENENSLHYIKNIKMQDGSSFPYFNDSFNGQFSTDTSTVVFIVPRDAETVEDVSVSTLAKISSNGSNYNIRNYKVSAYASEPAKVCAEAVVLANYTDGFDFRNFDYGSIAKIGVVTRIDMALNDEGEHVNRVYIEDGYTTYSYYTEDMNVLNYSLWADRGDKVEVGDIVRYVVDSSNNVLVNGGIFSMYDNSAKAVIAANNYSGGTTFVPNSRKCLIAGYVNYVGGGYMEISEKKIEAPINYENDKTYVITTEAIPIMIYYNDKGTTEIGTMQDINTYRDNPGADNKVFAIVNEMKPVLIVLYRDTRR